MAKLQLMDTMPDVIIKMAEGNPGACSCLLAMLGKKDWFARVDPIMMILMLDEMGIYGSKLYMLWSDACDKDLSKMELVLRNYQLGHLKIDVIKRNLNQGRARPFEGLLSLEELFARPV